MEEPIVDNDRRNEIMENLAHETEAPCTQEWRDELTAEELDFVAQQSDQYCRSVCAICSATLVRERLRRRFPPRDLLEVETVWDHCRVRLRDGRLLLARLEKDGGLRLDEIDGVC